MKGALTLFAQDATSKLILYTGADIKKDEADDEVLEFLSFFRATYRKVRPTFIFDSKFTTYANLSELNRQGVKFITPRRRGRYGEALSMVEDRHPPREEEIPEPGGPRIFRPPQGLRRDRATGHSQGQRA